MAPIPPPSILLRGNEAPPPDSVPLSGIYYSIPEDGGRSLNEAGQFVSFRESGSLADSESSRDDGEGVSREEEEGVSREEEGEGVSREEEGGGVQREEGEGVEMVGEEDVLGKVTEVVKAVMELSNKVSLSPPDEYLELVKVVVT